MLTPTGLPRWPSSGRSLRDSLRNVSGNLGQNRFGRAVPVCFNEHKCGLVDVSKDDDGDTVFSTRNAMFDESDAMLGGLVFDGLVGGEQVPDRLTKQWAGGRISGNLGVAERDIMYALEYFVEHERRRPPFVKWHEDGLED